METICPSGVCLTETAIALDKSFTKYALRKPELYSHMEKSFRCRLDLVKNRAKMFINARVLFPYTSVCKQFERMGQGRYHLYFHYSRRIKNVYSFLLPGSHRMLDRGISKPLCSHPQRAVLSKTVRGCG